MATSRAHSVRAASSGLLDTAAVLERVDPVDPGDLGPRSEPLPVQDLRVYEAHGGHTLSRHVNTPPGDELRRIKQDQVAAAGSFTNQATAQWCVRTAINSRRADVRGWLRSGEREPYVFVHDMGRVIGRSLNVSDVRRGMNTPRLVSCVRVVLRRNAALPGGFLVVTAYPTRAPARRR